MELSFPKQQNDGRRLTFRTQILLLMNITRPIFVSRHNMAAIVGQAIRLIDRSNATFGSTVLRTLLRRFHRFLYFSTIRDRFSIIRKVGLPRAHSGKAMRIDRRKSIKSRSSRVFIKVFFIRLGTLIMSIFPTF